jgi:hypothetical protein
MSFHTSGNASIGLLPGFAHQLRRQKGAKQKHHDGDHDGCTDEFRKANSQPISTIMMMLSSITRLVDASWNATAAVKLAPLRNTERASATAA